MDFQSFLTLINKIPVSTLRDKLGISLPAAAELRKGNGSVLIRADKIPSLIQYLQDINRV